ncbi:hypothetical protein BF95_22325 [Sphingobium sp. Ant17]|nr:hypothetical protein BF95_22325 [Sphingobium sp. Ant17]
MVGVGPTVMKKLPIAELGRFGRAMDRVASRCRIPVWVVGSCTTGGKDRRASLSIPPWINPSDGAAFRRAAR